MAGKKINVLRIPGISVREFENIFCSYIQTGREESRGILSDFSGGIDPDGNFYITRRGKDGGRLNYEARLTGSIRGDAETKETVIEYSTEMSSVFTVCMVVLGLLCFGFLGYALLAYFKAERTGPLLPASFFTVAFLTVLTVSVLRPECRSLEKIFDTVVGEYAGRLGTEEKEKES